jgi:hypothetical protein
MNHTFKFKLGTKVKIKNEDVVGTIIGRTQFLNGCGDEYTIEIQIDPPERIKRRHLMYYFLEEIKCEL